MAVVMGTVAVLGVLANAAPALAHIDPDPPEAPAGSEVSVGFTVEHQLRRVAHHRSGPATARRHRHAGARAAGRVDGQRQRRCDYVPRGDPFPTTSRARSACA